MTATESWEQASARGVSFEEWFRSRTNGGSTWSNDWDALALATTKRETAAVLATLGVHVIILHGVLDDGSCTCGTERCRKQRSEGKHPLESNWQTQPFNPVGVDDFLAKNPAYNIGIRNGLQPRRIMLGTVDFDGTSAELAIKVAELQERVGECLPFDTLAQRTRKGSHAIYNTGDVEFPNVAKLRTLEVGAEQVDLRGPGGQIVCAPSRHRTGFIYQWYQAREPAVLPRKLALALVELAGKPEDKSATGATLTDAQTEAAELFARYLTPGRRYHMHRAFSGFARLAGVRAEHLVEVMVLAAELAGDDERGRPEFEQMVERAREGERAEGGPTLEAVIGDDGPEVVAKFKELLRPPEKATVNLLRDYAKYLTSAKVKSDSQRALGHALTALIAGRQVDRDSMLKLADALGHRFSQHDPTSIVDCFVKSLQELDAADRPDVSVLTERVRRAQSHAREQRAERRRERRDAKTARIREAFGSERTTPYTRDEIESFGRDIRTQWIIRRGKSFYLFVNGVYRGPFTDDAVNAAVTHLAPAKTAGVELYRDTKDGPMLRSAQSLVEEYGTVAEDTEIHLLAEKTSYDSKRRVMIEVPCPLRPLTPTWHEDIDTWLQFLCGGGSKWESVYPERPNGRRNYIRLCKWLSAVTRLDRACAALFLTGAKSTGKSLLALGLSRLWTTKGVTALEDGFADFNDAILTCPLTFADEQLPKDFQGFVKFGELRVHIQQLERGLNRKHIPIARLIGATRTIIAANNERILETAENLSVEDIGAIAVRLLHIPVQPEAALCLEFMKTFEQGWVEQNKIAEHALWLRDNYHWEDEGRFLIDSADERLVRSLLVRSGIRSALCQFLLGYLTEPRKLDRVFEHEGKLRKPRLVRTRNGELLANIHGIVRYWGIYVSAGDKTPTMGRAASALATLSEPGDRRVEDVVDDGDRRVRKTTRYHVVNIENLVQWSELALGMTQADIRAALQREPNSEMAAAYAREKARGPFAGMFGG